MIRKFFGQGDVFIYAKSDTTLKGITYRAGEQIAYFSGVSMALEYLLDHKEAQTSSRQLSNVIRHPHVLNIGGVPNTKELEKIFFTESRKEEVTFSVVDSFTDVEDMIFLKRQTLPLKVRMFSDKKEITGTLNEDNSIDIDGAYKKVDVVSTFKADGGRRGFDKPNIGYVSIKATVIGKLGDKESVFILDVPTADLISEPIVDLSDESNYNLSLSFALINADKNKPTVVQIDG